MRVTEADREFGRGIADVMTSLRGGALDPLDWVADTVSLKAPPERYEILLNDLRGILVPVLDDGLDPDDDVRARCTEAYVNWLADL